MFAQLPLHSVELRNHGGGVCILSLAIGGNAVNYIVVEGICSDVDSPIEPRVPNTDERV